MPKSIQEMQAEILQLQQAVSLSGVPAEERAIYEATIGRIRAAIAAKQGPATPVLAPPQSEPTKHATPPQTPPRRIPASESMEEAAEPLTASIEAEKDTDPYNPRIRITWRDGYSITVDETECRGRFTTTLRDTCTLRCVQKDGRFEKMWRWSSPWRALYFYQALIEFNPGERPTLQSIGITRPSKGQISVFTQIQSKALTANI